MKRFFESGGAFMLVALLCIAAGLISGSRGAGAAGALLLIMAIAMRARSSKKRLATPESERKNDAT
ncbi:MAG: hypothetical protein FJY88_02045 [Candidatus Eisenbacteria bacterium]|nr:hypothetical protein [Candidatus Eisenbacteria bacterium]